MSRRRTPEGEIISLDSFLNICTIAVGGLVLIALVTVLGAGDVSISTGATAMAAPKPSARRILVEAEGDRLYVVDEDGVGQKVLDEAQRRDGGPPSNAEGLMALLREKDVGDATHRVLAEESPEGLSWVYARREDARGTSLEDLARGGTPFHEAIAGAEGDTFLYVVVHDDSFEAFRRAREIAAARGMAVGWHPVVSGTPLRLSSAGALGKRIQ